MMVVFKILWKVVATGLRLWWRIAVVVCLLVFGFVFLQVAITHRTLRAFSR